MERFSCFIVELSKRRLYFVTVANFTVVMKALTPLDLCWTGSCRWRVSKKLWRRYTATFTWSVSAAHFFGQELRLLGEWAPSISLTQDTTLPLKQGSLALSSEISSLTTLGNRQTDTVRFNWPGEGHGVSWATRTRLSLETLHFPASLTHTETCSRLLHVARKHVKLNERCRGLWFMNVVCAVTLNTIMR